MKFSGQNFQPWSDFELDITGLTIVIGPSNGGKSSLYRALRGILRNELDVAYIRNPKDEPLKLTLEHAGKTVVATRTKKGSVHYQIDEEKFDKLDGDIPPAVKDFKFGEIRIGEFVFDPIFASQNRPQFLIDNDTFKPSQINAIFGAFGGTEKLEAGKKQANLQKTQKDAEARVLAGQIRTAEEHKAKLDAMSVRAHALSDEFAGLESFIQQLETETHWLEETAQCCKRIAPVQRILDSLVPPDATGIEPLRQFSVSAEQAALAGSFAKWINRPLQAIETATEDWNAALALWRQIKALNETLALISDEFDTQELQAFRTEINVNDLISLRRSIELLEHVIALRKELQETAKKSAAIDDELSAAQSESADAQKAIHDAALEAERQRAEELKSKGLCPKCGKTLEHICP